LRQGTLFSVRAKTCGQSGRTSVFARAHKIEIGKPWSFDDAEPDLTGAEQLLGILASDVTGLFVSICQQRGLIVDGVEATVKAELANTLRYLGVIGAAGTPAYETFQLRVHVESPTAPEALGDAWNEAIERAPFLNVLKRGAEVDVSMQVTD
jgi:hypothetical protein